MSGVFYDAWAHGAHLVAKRVLGLQGQVLPFDTHRCIERQDLNPKPVPSIERSGSCDAVGVEMRRSR